MTINDAIKHADSMKPNTFSDEEKFRWISDLDGMICRLVAQEKEGVEYVCPDDMDTQLLVRAPFEGIYALWLEAQIDFHNREYNEYNNTIQMFNSLFEEYKKAYIREIMPAASGRIKNL